MDDYLYKEEIIDHYKSPQNFGILKKFSNHSQQLNPFCGDQIDLYIRIQDGKVSDVSFQGHGCAISIAAGSILTEYIRGRSLTALTNFSKQDMLEQLGVAISETRKKCALLAWATLQDCLK
jgi:nitrogen fixation NifU-like protein